MDADGIPSQGRIPGPYYSDNCGKSRMKANLTDTVQADTGWIESTTGGALLDPEFRALLAVSGRPAQLPANVGVFSPGSPCSAYLIVLEGAVRVQMLATTGREILLYRVQPGESCVLTTACLLGNEAYPAEGITEAETLAVAVPIERFKQLLATTSQFRDHVFAGFGRRIADILARMEDAVFHRIDLRLARLLLERADDKALAVTHQEIATELGTAREVVSRQLKAFEKDGLVRLGRGSIEIVNRRRLRELTISVT